MATLVSETERRLPEREALAQWIVQQGLDGNAAEMVIEGFCTRLSAGGIQIQRGLCATRVLHPLYKGFGLIWRRASGRVEEEIYTSGNANPRVWERSTFKVMADDGEPEVRRRILGPEAGEEFPILEDLRQEGATDYFGMICGYAVESANDQRFGIIFTFCTDREDGFSDAELDFSEPYSPPLR